MTTRTGEPMVASARSLAPSLEVRNRSPHCEDAAPPRTRSPLWAFALAVTCPGLGHLYAGSLAAAMVSFAFVSLAYLVPVLFVAADGNLLVMLAAWACAAIALWCAQGLHAARLVRRRHGLPERGYQRTSGYVGFLGIVFAINALTGHFFEDVVLASYLPTSESMLPTLAPGDRYLVTKLTPRDQDPRRGDVIVFRAPTGEDEDWVKRVIGRPGDHLAFNEGWLTMNGVPARYQRCATEDEVRLLKLAPNAECYDEVLPNGRRHPVAREQGLHPPQGHSEFIVPPGYVFVLGDNRDRSVDSRFLGPIPISSILGRAHTVWQRADPDGPFVDVGRVP